MSAHRQADLRQAAAAYVTLAKAVDTLYLMHRRAGGVDEAALDWKETVRDVPECQLLFQCRRPGCRDGEGIACAFGIHCQPPLFIRQTSALAL